MQNNQDNDKSDTVKFYYAVQARLGGTLPWSSLHPMHQLQFTQAVNAVYQITQLKQGEYDAG